MNKNRYAVRYECKHLKNYPYTIEYPNLKELIKGTKKTLGTYHQTGWKSFIRVYFSDLTRKFLKQLSTDGKQTYLGVIHKEQYQVFVYVQMLDEQGYFIG